VTSSILSETRTNRFNVRTVALTSSSAAVAYISLFFRNNLTVFDMVTIKGHGAKELLRVGGKLPGPGASLRFNVPQSTLMECRDGEIDALLCYYSYWYTIAL